MHPKPPPPPSHSHHSPRLSPHTCLPNHHNFPPSPPTSPPSVSPLHRSASPPARVRAEHHSHPHNLPLTPSAPSSSSHAQPAPVPTQAGDQHLQHHLHGTADHAHQHAHDAAAHSHQHTALIPNPRPAAHSLSLPDRPALTVNAPSTTTTITTTITTTTTTPHHLHHAAVPSPPRNVSFHLSLPHPNSATAPSSVSVASSHSASLPARNEPSNYSHTLKKIVRRPRPSAALLNSFKLSAIVQQPHQPTSSENNLQPTVNNSLPSSLSNRNTTYSSSIPSTSCTSQPSYVAHLPTPSSSSSAAPRTPTHASSFSLGRDRPPSPPPHSQPPPHSAHAPAFSLYASPCAGRYFSPRTYHPAPVPTSKTRSFLECVLEMLKGATVNKRRTFMHHPQIHLWLTADLCELRYTHAKKRNAPVVERLPLCHVSKLKGSEREVSMEFSDARKSVEFLFASKGSADIWLSGLCCLTPAYATVKSRDRLVRQRENYDPLTDSWNGKKVESRKRLADYILLGTIGRGSFGKVKLALSVHNRQFYAVKVLSKAMISKRIRSIPVNGVYVNPKQVTELEAKDVSEIQVMESLRHENVMQYIGVYNDTQDDRFFLILEFVSRGPIMSSAKLKGADPLTLDRARRAFVDVLAGIEYLQHMSIAHRDIKPDNLLEAGDGTVKISDFGAAVKCKPASDGTPATRHSTAGTPAFTAPEVAISDSAPKHAVDLLKADMWSLGATLYYMIYGQAPFIAQSVFEMYDIICTEELSFPSESNVPSDVRSLISALLQKNPEDRASIADCLRSPWISRCAAVAEKVESVWRAIELHGGQADRPPVEASTAPSSSTSSGRNSRIWYKQR